MLPDSSMDVGTANLVQQLQFGKPEGATSSYSFAHVQIFVIIVHIDDQCDPLHVQNCITVILDKPKSTWDHESVSMCLPTNNIVLVSSFEEVLLG